MDCSKYFTLFTLFLFLVSCSNQNDSHQKISEIKPIKSFEYSDYSELDSLCEKLGDPNPNEWRYENDESRQSFAEYISKKRVRPTKVRNIIYILPIGKFNQMEQKLLENTAAYVKIFFMLDVKLLSPVSNKVVPKKSRRVNYNVEQLQTKYILNDLLLPNIPKDAISYIAITNIDLYPDENWNFVFGQASTANRIGVSSFCRFYNKILDTTNYKLCLERILQTTTHELGHMFSLKHCVIDKCLLNGCNSLYEADNQPLWLCPECLAKLQWCIKFDLIKRYNSLIDFSNSNGFEKEKLFYLKSKKIMENIYHH